AAERVTLERGGRASWNVALERREGFKGEVTLEATGLPAGVEARPGVIPADKISGRLELIARDDAALEGRSVQVTGRARLGEREVCRTASVNAARTSGSGPGFEPYTSSAAWLSVVPAPLFALESAISELFLLRGGTAELGVRISRRKGFDGELEFALENAPAGGTIDKFEVIDQGRLARLTLRAAEGAASGRVGVTLIGAAATQAGRRTESAPKFNLQVN